MVKGKGKHHPHWVLLGLPHPCVKWHLTDCQQDGATNKRCQLTSWMARTGATDTPQARRPINIWPAARIYASSFDCLPAHPAAPDLTT